MCDSTVNNRKKAISDIHRGDHLCLIYESQEEQFFTAIPFMQIGLRRNERCAYLADENSINEVVDAMKFIDTHLFTEAIDNKSLVMLNKTDSYVKDGYFEPAKMINFLKRHEIHATDSGRSGLRVTGEMTWMLAGDPGSEKLMEYESKLNLYLPNSKTCAICQYNRNKFSEKLLMDVFRTHPFVIYKNRIIANSLYISPDEFERSPKNEFDVDTELEKIKKTR